MAAFSSVDLSRYVRIGRYDLPEPTRTLLPSGTPAWNLLAQEASAVTYNKDSDTLFVLGDGGTAIVEVSKTGQLISTMTLAKGGSPQGTEFYDPEGLAYVGNGTFVFTEERDRQLVRFTYQAGGTLQRSASQTVKLGTTIGNIGLEGVSFDPLTANSYILVKEISPQGVFQSNINFDLVPLGSISNGGSPVASNGSSTAANSTNLFNPANAGLADFADVYALSNVAALNGTVFSGDLLILSQESGKVVEISRDGTVRSSLTLQLSPGDKQSIADQTHEGITMDADGNLYIVSENGGGDINHPQLWVYAATTAANQAPTDVQLVNPVTSLYENIPITAPYKLADLAIVDDGLGTNTISVSGPDAAFFQADATGLYLKAGTVLDYETKNRYDANVDVNDSTVGDTPDAARAFSLSLIDVVNENAPVPSLAITEVSPWSSGNSLYKADWFEVTNTGSTTVDLSGIRMDDDSNAFGNSVVLQGVDSLAPGRSAVFIEAVDNESATNNQLTTLFKTSWFGANVPAGLQIGTYSGAGVGLSTGGDAVNLFDRFGRLITGVKVPASTTYFTFTNGSGAGASSFPTPTVSTLSALGVNAFASKVPATGSTYEIGSPGASSAPAYNFSATSYTATEAATNGGLNNGVVRVTRSGDLSQTSSVVLTLSDGTAKGAAPAPAEGTSTGPSTTTTPYVLPAPGSGVATKSLLTVGDAVGGYKMAGIPDGLGAYDNGDGTFTLLMNHEISSTSGAARAHGGKGAFVSSWVIKKSDLSVVSGEDLIKNVYGWDATSQQSNATANNTTNNNGINFNRFCSADLAEPTAFYNAATGKGSQARIFLNGEEGGSNGFALANVATGSSKGNSYVLGKFNLTTNGSGATGVGGWENLLANPLAQDKTVVIGNNDGGTGLMTGTVVVYQGTKTTTGSEADKAGLTNGNIKFIAVNGSADSSGSTVDEIINTTTRATGITNGTRFSLSSTAATTFSRPEDGAWNPNNPNEYFFVTTDRLDQASDGVGSQVGMTRLWKLTFDDITNPDLGGKIDLLIDGAIVNGKKVNMFDNISIDKSGRITLLEDVGNAEHNGKIWQYDTATGALKLLAQHDPARFGDVGIPATAPFTVDEETSGVIDMQSILGPGWSLLVDQAHYTSGIPADLVEGGQLLALFNKDVYNAYQPDYINTAQTVTFAGGETFKDVNVPVLGDTRLEGEETVTLSLGSPSAGGVVGVDKPSATLTIQDLNPTPTDLQLSKINVDENVPVGTVVGTLSTTAPISGDSFSYALVSGTGSADNDAFVIVDNQLKFNTSPNFEAKSSYSVRVRTTQQGGQSFEKLFTISINDLAEAATISGTATASVTEGKGVNAAGLLIATGNLTVNDQDAGQAKFNTTVTPASGNLGNLVISETGQLTYSLSNSLPAVQLLGAGQTKTDTFTVKSFDGSASKDIVITINGASAGFNAVASGDPTTNRITLWTRTFDNSDSTGRTGITEAVTVQVATDNSFIAPVFTANAVTSGAANDYTLKLDATGLTADTTYYYRFKTLAGELSPTGTFQTTPAPNSRVAVRIAHSGDADGLMRPYPLMADVATKKFDAFIFNGDTIYETSSTGSAATPATKDAETGVVSQQTLGDAYRRKYLENLLPAPGGTYSGLKEFYASQANITTWDNHELGNKVFINGGAPYSLRTGSTNGSTNTADDVNTAGKFINDTTTFDTLLQAFLDYQPIRNPEVINAPSDPRSDGELKLYNTQMFGLGAQVINLDTRTFRDVRLNKVVGTSTADDTGARADNPNRTLLGATQKAWLKQSLLDAQASGVTWKFINTSDPIDMIGAYGGTDDGGKSWWGGYRAERNEILKFIADNGISNVVFLASDDHTFRVNELTYMPDPTLDPSNPANYKVLKGAISIVDGPMGATGPNTITDHSFANIQSLTDAVVAKQVAAGINPVGLDKNFPGLSNIYREGDETAASNPKPFDFVSPDTNNYVSLEVMPNGVLNVTLRGINSYATNAFPEPSATNAPRTILSFSIDPFDSSQVITSSSADDSNLPDQTTVPLYRAQSQTLFTGAGKDEIDNALVSGHDNKVFAGSDADTVFASERDVITGGSGADSLWATHGDGNRLDGGLDNDTFYIGTSRNRALGGAGNDKFFILEGAGTNYLNGGVGNDQFWLISAPGDLPGAKQFVMDFKVGDDKVGLQGVAFSSLSFTQVGADTLLKVAGTDVGHFTGVSATSLNNPLNFAGLL